MSDKYEKRMLELEQVDPIDIWSLDISFAHWIVPRLEMLKESGSTPGSIDNESEWINILDTMIEGFNLVRSGNYCTNFGDEFNEKINEALRLFSIYFRNLWC
jgi:hypothetical protein